MKSIFGILFAVIVICSMSFALVTLTGSGAAPITICALASAQCAIAVSLYVVWRFFGGGK